MVDGTYELCVRFPTSNQVDLATKHIGHSTSMRLNGNEPNIAHIVDAKEGRLVGLISAQSLGLCNTDDPSLHEYHDKLREVFARLALYGNVQRRS